MTSTETLLASAQKINLLTREQEAHYAAQMRTGDAVAKIEARNSLVAANIRFAATLAYDLAKTSSISVDDYMSAALEAMVKNTEKFDPTRANYCTFIKPWIRKAIHEVHHSETNLSIPRHKHISANKVKNATQRLVERHGPFESITNEMIADESGMKVSEVEECQHLAKTMLPGTISLQMPTYDNDGRTTLADSVAKEHTTYADIDGISVDTAEALMTLSPLERDVLERATGVYDGDEHSTSRIARDLDLRNKAAAETLLDSAKEKMRALL